MKRNHRDLYVEIAGLNTEAVDSADKIQENFEEIIS